MTEILHDISVGRTDAAVDDPAGLLVSGLPPAAPVGISVELDCGPQRYLAHAEFEADARGCVDTAWHASRGGTYRGLDPFGLFWSGRPVGPGASAGLDPMRGVVRVQGAGFRVEAPLTRRWLAPDAIVTEVGEPGVSGVYVRPAGTGPFPAVVAFGGSSGGLGPSGTWAAVLAHHGFATIAISYFGGPGLPPALVGIEIECVERAITWLRGRPEVSTDPVGVLGISRGSELALLAGAHFPDVGGVVAIAPSGVTWCGLGPRGPVDAAAWTHRGEPVPYAPLTMTQRPPRGRAFALRPLFESALADSARIRAAEIPVERIDGPVLLVSGEDDAMWPSARMAEIAVRRWADHGSGHPVRHLRYPRAGHTGVGVPGIPTELEVRHPLDGGHYAFGGSASGNAAARASSWPEVVTTLAQAAHRGRPRPA
ncbi:acyl-CoA thioesterase/bile acid-CoA:amino acid N-acyltransferase family protein [Amycolatopsis thermophila]|uniref:Dienelactone hydrolase n=1 Tax=Amycolatopsis thermophila TaxID=206084 RepID=A0ABU0F731_9PSEU|nr:acyl-CoA thioesterase/bile acid-CoA:amino acid N-acyltransferase family protein [Amycolatopsis thermophila]MDQ0382926.1 dienelactone hydrolase [Amycolatopsis thermophila]